MELWEGDQQEITAAMYEEVASTIRASKGPQECVPKMIMVLITGLSMLGGDATAMLDLFSMPFGGIEGLKEITQRAVEE